MLGQKINTVGSTLARVYSQKVLKPPPILQVLDVYMSLSKCSPWFGSHSVVKVLSSKFEFDYTPNKGLNKMSWSKLPDGVSCLSWWFDIFMAKMVWCQETVDRFFLQQGNRLTVFLPPLLKVGCKIFFRDLESLGKSNGKKLSIIWIFCLEMV